MIIFAKGGHMLRPLRLIALGALLTSYFLGSQASAARVWWEYGLASATAGYDGNNNRTLIHKWYLVAYGPDTVEEEARNYIRECLAGATARAVNAFYAAPSPEVGARVAAAYTSFHGSIRACLQLQNVARHYLNSFDIGYTRRELWEPGLVVRFHADSPSVQIYTQMHNAVRDRLPDPVNRVITFYIDSQRPPDINIQISVPPAVGRFIAVLPQPADLERMRDEANRRLQVQGRQVAEVVGREVQELVRDGRRLGESAATAAGQVLVTAPVAALSGGAEAVGRATEAVRREGQRAVDSTRREGQTAIDNTRREGQTAIDNTRREIQRAPDNVRREVERIIPRF